MLSLGLAGVRHNPDHDAPVLGGHEGRGQLAGGEVEDGQVDAGLREVDGAEEAVPDPAVRGEVDVGLGQGGGDLKNQESGKKPASKSTCK